MEKCFYGLPISQLESSMAILERKNRFQLVQQYLSDKFD